MFKSFTKVLFGGGSGGGGGGGGKDAKVHPKVTDEIKHPDSAPTAAPALLLKSASMKEQEELTSKFHSAQKHLPESYDKSITLLQLHFELQFKMKEKKTGYTPLLLDAKHAEELLRNQLDRENLMDSSIRPHIEKLGRLLSLPDKERNYKGILQQIDRLMYAIRPLDFNTMLSLIEMSKKSSKIIEGKDIIFLLGGTGVGKSTTIHFLCGSVMSATTVNGVKHIEPTQYKYEVLETFKTNPLSNSETRYINAVTIDLKEVGASSEGQVVICDSPGFGDTAGPEVDIANGIGIASAMRTCKSIKPVILIGKPSMGERLEGILKLTKVLVKIFGSVENNLSSFNYVFTKFDKSEKDNISAMIQDKLRQITRSRSPESMDDNFMMLLEDIVEKTKDGATIIDPIGDKCGELLDKVVQSPSIQDPNSVISNFITPEASEMFQQQLQRHKSTVRCALRLFELDLVQHKIRQLIQVKEELGITSYEAIVVESIQEIVRLIVTTKNQFESSLKRVTDEGNSSVDEDMIQIGELYHKLSKLETLRCSFSDYFADMQSSLVEVASLLVVNAAHALMTSFLKNFNRNVFKNNSESLSEESFSFAAAIILLGKLADLSAACTEAEMVNSTTLATYSDQCTAHGKTEWVNSCEEIKQSIISIDLESFCANMSFVKMVEGPLKRFIADSSENSSSKYDTLRSDFLKSLSTKMQACLDILKKEEISESDASGVYHFRDQISPAKFPVSIGKHLDPEEISSIDCRIKSSVLAIMTECVDKVRFSYTDKSQSANFVEIASRLRTLESLVNYPDIKQERWNELFEIETSLQMLIKDTRDTLLSYLSAIEATGTCDLSLCEVLHENLIWAHTQLISYPRVYDQQYSDFKQEFDSYISRLAEYIPNSNISIQNHKDINLILKKVSCTVELASKVDNANTSLTDIVNSFLCKELEQVHKFFASKDFSTIISNFTKCRDHFSYYYECSILDLKPVRESINSLTVVIEKMLQDFKSYLTSRLSEAFESMMTSSDTGSTAILVSLLDLLPQMDSFYKANPLTVADDTFYKQMFVSVPNEVDHTWRGNDDSMLAVLHKSMLEAQRKSTENEDIDEMYNLMGSLDNLQPIDRFLPPNCTPKFFELNSLIQLTVNKCVEDVVGRMKIAVRASEYEKLAEIFPKMSNTPQMLKAVDDLTNDLRSRLEKLHSVVDILSKDSLGDFMALLGRVDRAQDNVFRYLNPLDKESFSEVIVQVKTKAQKWALSGLDVVVSHIRNMEYSKVFGVIQEVRQIGAEFNVMEVLLEEFDGMFTDFLSNACVHSKQSVKDAVEGIIHGYEDPDINARIKEVSPKVFASALKDAASADSSFQEDFDKLITALKQRVELLCNEKDESSEDIESALNELEEMNPFLPSELEPTIENATQELKKSLKLRQQEAENLVKESQSAGNNFRKKVDIVVGEIRKSETKSANKLRDGIRKGLETLDNLLQKDSKQGNLISVLHTLPDTWSNIEYYIEQIQTAYGDVDAEEKDQDDKSLRSKTNTVVSGVVSYAKSFFGGDDSRDRRFDESDYDEAGRSGHNKGSGYGDNGQRTKMSTTGHNKSSTYDGSHTRNVSSGYYNASSYGSSYPYSADSYSNRDNSYNSQGYWGGGNRYNSTTSYYGSYSHDNPYNSRSYWNGRHQLSAEEMERQRKESAEEMERQRKKREIEEERLKKQRAMEEKRRNISEQFRKDKEIFARFQCTFKWVLDQITAFYNQINSTKVGHPDSLRIVAIEFEKLSAIIDTYSDWPVLKQSLDKMNLNPVLMLATLVQICKAHQALFLKAIDSGDSRELSAVLASSEKLAAMSFFDKTLKFVKGEVYSEFKEALDSCFRYQQMQDELRRVASSWRDTILNSALGSDAPTVSNNAYDRDEFYKKYSSTFLKLRAMQPLGNYLGTSIFDVNTIERDCRDHFSRQFAFLDKKLEDLLQRFPLDEPSSKKFANINDNFRSLIETFEDSNVQGLACDKLENWEHKFRRKLIDYCQSEIHGGLEDDDIVEKLLPLKAMTLHIPAFKEYIDEGIETLLSRIKKDHGGTKRIGTLGLLLNKHDNKGIAQMIISETKILNGYALALRNEKTLRVGPADILKEIRGDGIDKEGLETHYSAYEKEYWELVESGILKTKTHEVLASLPEKARKISGASCGSQEKVRHIVAHICAYWTLENVKSNGTGAVDDAAENPTPQENFNLRRPHAAQIFAVFRLLGIEEQSGVGSEFFIEAGDANRTRRISLNQSKLFSRILRKQLVQIFTGEGKSLILAITSIALSIMGCVVSCACYSEYLSKRDYEGFSALFDAFGIKDQIRYGTFHNLCEEFINQSGVVRDLVKASISSSSVDSVRKQPDERPKILLIDEVDVFFSSDFYGNVYKPLARITDKTVTVMIKYIWNNRADKSKLTFRSIKTTSEFGSLKSRFASYGELIDECVKMMISDLKTFESQEYIVQDDKIGYKDQDSISFQISYGYKTIFAYFKEHYSSPPKITAGALETQLALVIECGDFSYAEIPKLFDCVMGVTGTLETLLPPERSLLETVYSIRRNTYIPSVYGANNRKFAGDTTRDVLIETSTSFHMELTNQINDRLISLDRNDYKRAVLVFFETTPKLIAFYNSPQLAAIKDDVRIMTELTSAKDKEGIVRSAVTSGAVTLLNRAYGRGTDFYCYDDRLVKSGGIHVIQTFVSEILSEETQIMGRTARQGNQGSYSMVLINGELEKYEIRDPEIAIMKNTSSLYTTLNQKRNEFFQKMYPESMRHVGDIQKCHQEAIAFVQNIVLGNTANVKAFLMKQNLSPAIDSGISRTMVLMDATGSMSGLIERAKNTVQTMFERVNTVLQEKDCHAVVQLQFAVYRNYGQSAADILQASGWETNPSRIQQFMKSISASGGSGFSCEEAVEIGLFHALQEDQIEHVNQVILIGDAPPNTESDRIKERQAKGESYWGGTKYANCQYYTFEVDKLREREVKVHAFHVASNAAAGFADIAQRSQGRHAYLDINSSQGADLLTNVVCEEVLNNVGGVEFVSEYRKLFTRGFTG